MTKRYLMKFLKFLLLILIINNELNRMLILQYKFLQQEFKLEEPQINELVYSID